MESSNQAFNQVLETLKANVIKAYELISSTDAKLARQEKIFLAQHSPTVYFYANRLWSEHYMLDLNCAVLYTQASVEDVLEEIEKQFQDTEIPDKLIVSEPKSPESACKLLDALEKIGFFTEKEEAETATATATETRMLSAAS